MIALCIILGVLLILFLITLIKVEVFARYSETLTLQLKVLFLRFTLLPSKKKEKKPKEKPRKQDEKKPESKEKKEKEKKPSYLSKLREKKGLSGILSLLTQLVELATGALRGVFSHLVIKRLDIGIALSSGDAASTAVNYGRLCSVVYPAVDVITSVTVCEDYNVTLEPVFDEDRPTEISADVHAYIRILFALIEGVKAAAKLLIIRIKL